MSKKIIVASIVLILILVIGARRSLAAYDIVPFGSARAIGLAEAVTSVVDNTNSLFYNPSAVEFISNQNILIGAKIDSNMNGYLFSYTLKISENDLIGLGMNHTLSRGTTESSSGLNIISYAHRVGDQFIIGFSGERKYVGSDGFSGYGYSGNMGFYYSPLKYISLGLAIRNIIKTNIKTGTNSEEAIPTGISMGFSMLQDNPILERICVDIAKHDVSDEELYFSGSLDMKLFFNIYLWKGWSYNPERAAVWEETFGAGIPIMDNLRIEYSNDEDSNYISLSYKM